MSASERLGEIARRAKETQEAIANADVMQDMQSVSEVLRLIAIIQTLSADVLNEFASSIIPLPIYDSRIDP
jgi:hypothetical protein